MAEKLTLADPEVGVVQQQKPLEGAQLVIMTIALSLATFMQVLDSTIASVGDPHYRRESGLIAQPGNVGNHFFRGGECHLDPAYRLAGKARRGSETVPFGPPSPLLLRRGRVVSPAA
ncbi:hypothetical protein ACLK2F_15120 [Escherichia coli]